MATTYNIQQPLQRILGILRYERKEISAIYFYVILGGIVQLSLPLGIQSIISYVMGGSISTSLIILIILVIIGVLVNGVLKVNSMKEIEKIQQQLFVRYSFQYAFTIPRMDLQAVDGYYLPELVNRFFDTLSLQKGISKLLLDVPAATVQIIFGLILLSFYHPVFIAFGAVLVLILYLLFRFTGSRGIATAMLESDYKYKVAGYLQELARVVSTFKFAGSHSPHIHKTDGMVTGYLQARTAHFRILNWQYWTLIVFKLLVTAAMLIVGAVLLVDQQISVGQFIAAEIIILLLVGSVEKLITSLDNVYDVLTAAEKVSKVTDKPQEEDGQIALPAGPEGMAIRLQNISLHYTPGSPVLKEVDLVAAANDKICIQGSAAGGKGTLLRLLSGSLMQFEGVFTADGNPFRSVQLNSYRQQTGVLLRQHGLYEGTLWENITVGRPGIDRSYVMQLSKICGLSTFVETHPLGFDMPINTLGKQLPQRIIKQILWIRALAHKPRLLLLEEPCQGLEPADAQRMQAFLANELVNTTLIIVSDKEAYTRFCNKVFTMEEGMLKTISSHKD